MTNSEAIEVLKANYPDPCFEELRQAVDIAILTLSKRPDQIARDIATIIENEMDMRVILQNVEPRKIGKWIKRKNGALGFNCSCCGKSDISDHFAYCPSCGAEMRG